MPTHLVIMACSATKATEATPAIELYRGVMYSTLRANMRAQPPAIVILSARYGFLLPDQTIAPYEQRMTDMRAGEMLANLPAFDTIDWPSGLRSILLAGGKAYRHVMHAAVQRRIGLGMIAVTTTIGETAGGIGHQRAQLGTYLRSIAAGET
jgi:hypothetical protein